MLFYLVLFIFVYITFYFFGFFKIFPNNVNLTSFDGFWYQNIKNYGYQYNWYEPSSSAFFPMFPFAWKILHLNSIGISCLNFIVFASGIGLLKHHLNFSTTKLLLYLSFPTGIFFFIPYTESFFFLLSSIFLVGLHKNNQKLIFIGILLASVTRATAMFFIPSIIIMELLNSEVFFSKSFLKNIFLYSIASILGLLIVVLFQYSQTGEWFAFAKQQIRFWGHSFSIPGFPLISHEGEKTLWMDGFALFTGITSSFLILIALITKFFFKQLDFYFSNRPFWFSSLYICMITIYTMFFNAKSMDAQTTMNSINRYIFSTAFFPIFFIYCLQYFKLNIKYFIIYFFICIFSFLLIGMGGEELHFLAISGNGKYSFLFFCFLFVYISMHYFSSHIKYGKEISFMLFSLNVILATICFNDFISMVWVA